MESAKTQIVYHGDARDVTGHFGTVMISDPPYSAHVHGNMVSSSPGRGVRTRDPGFGHLTPELRAHVGVIASQIPRWSVIYSDVESLADWRTDIVVAGATYIRAIPWIRWSSPQLSGDRPPTGCEMLTIAWGSQKGRKSWNGPGNFLCFQEKCLRGEGKHKTEKPLDQALALVEFFTNEDDVVLDPFAGSGTTGLACKILNRAFIGVELDGEWVDKANARIGAALVGGNGRGGTLVTGLSDRDDERYQRYFDAKSLRVAEAARIDANTARVRARADAEIAKRVCLAAEHGDVRVPLVADEIILASGVVR